DFWKKLKKHLLPRILSTLRGQKDVDHDQLPLPDTCDTDAVISFNLNRLYLHRILRINYTTYDIRREQDLINAHSAQHNIMVLCQPTEDSGTNDAISYRYGRVLGTYHINVVYNGPGRPPWHQKLRAEIVWVRWYEELGQPGTDWAHRRLGRLRFLPIEDHDAFGFVDPGDIVRGCHIIPRFRMQKVHKSGKGHSPLAKDGSDWKEYYIGRFVDRDMMMRYHLGLGVGHIYGHQSFPNYQTSAPSSAPPAPTAAQSTASSSRDHDSGGSAKSDSDTDASFDLDDSSDSDESEDKDDPGDPDVDEDELYVEDMYSA
ncbi:hypothetical protein HWV62_32975, partial [Athelia sp. TMB]